MKSFVSLHKCERCITNHNWDFDISVNLVLNLTSTDMFATNEIADYHPSLLSTYIKCGKTTNYSHTMLQI